MNVVQVIFLAFGPNPNIYRQVFFALRTVQQHECERLVFNVITDRPHMFSNVKSDLCIHAISETEIGQWRGKYDFLFRVKIKAIEYIIDAFPRDHVLFLDSDTVMESHPQVIIDSLDAGNTVMHMNEKVLARSNDPADKALCKVLKGFECAGVTFTADTCMFNSGVVGLPSSSSKSLIARCLQVSDAMCETRADRSFIEQLAIGMVLHTFSQLETVEHAVIHYWGNKPEWDRFISSFIIDCTLQSLPKPRQLSLLKEMDLTELPIKSRRQINNQRLKALADKLFPRQRQIYFRKNLNKPTSLGSE